VFVPPTPGLHDYNLFAIQTSVGIAAAAHAPYHVLQPFLKK